MTKSKVLDAIINRFNHNSEGKHNYIGGRIIVVVIIHLLTNRKAVHVDFIVIIIVIIFIVFFIFRFVFAP